MLDQAQILKLEEKKRNAIGGRDAVAYRKAIDALGHPPELPDLYDAATTMIEYLRDKAVTQTPSPKPREETQPESPLETMTNTESRERRIRRFLAEASRHYINDIGAQAPSKRATLQAHFPSMAEGGKRDITHVPDAQVGVMFKSMYHRYRTEYR